MARFVGEDSRVALLRAHAKRLRSRGLQARRIALLQTSHEDRETLMAMAAELEDDAARADARAWELEGEA